MLPQTPRTRVSHLSLPGHCRCITSWGSQAAAGHGLKMPLNSVEETMARKGFQLTVQLLPNIAFIWSNYLYYGQSRDSWEYLMLTRNEGLSWKALSRSWHIFLNAEGLLQHWLNFGIWNLLALCTDNKPWKWTAADGSAESPTPARGFSTNRVTLLVYNESLL